MSKKNSILTLRQKKLVEIILTLYLKEKCNAVSLNLFFSLSLLYSIFFLLILYLKESIAICIYRCKRIVLMSKRKRERKERRKKFEFESNCTIKSKVSVTCILKSVCLCVYAKSFLLQALHTSLYDNG